MHIHTYIHVQKVEITHKLNGALMSHRYDKSSRSGLDA